MTALASSSNVSASNSTSDGGTYSLALRITFAFISVTSIVPNLLYLMAMLLNSGGIRRGYHNILLYNLMITDILAGVAIMVTPNLVIPEDLMKFPEGFLGKLFCHLLMSQFMVFLFGVASVYTIVFLSIERWFAVKHPFKYRTSISSTKTKICIALIWFVALLANTPHLMEMSPQYELNASNSCKWRSEKPHTLRNLLAVLEFSVKFAFPTVVLLVVLFSLYKNFYSKLTDTNRHPMERRKEQLLRMCTATSLAVLLCWSPNQVFYTLYKFGQVGIGTELHHFTVVLAVSTSSINPVIYFVTSKTYRTCLVSFLRRIFGKCKKASTRQSPRDIPLETFGVWQTEKVNREPNESPRGRICKYAIPQSQEGGFASTGRNKTT